LDTKTGELMAKVYLSKRKAHALSFALFLIALAILTWVKSWWPGIMLAVGLPLALRQYLLGRIYDTVITLFVFFGVFITVQFDIKWDILLPVLFTIGGIYIFFREFIGPKSPKEVEIDEKLNDELEEESEEVEEKSKEDKE
jgi:predicted membrane protein